jgi:hypothetical protein
MPVELLAFQDIHELERSLRYLEKASMDRDTFLFISSDRYTNLKSDFQLFLL